MLQQTLRSHHGGTIGELPMKFCAVLIRQSSSLATHCLCSTEQKRLLVTECACDVYSSSGSRRLRHLRLLGDSESESEAGYSGCPDTGDAPAGSRSTLTARRQPRCLVLHSEVTELNYDSTLRTFGLHHVRVYLKVSSCIQCSASANAHHTLAAAHKSAVCCIASRRFACMCAPMHAPHALIASPWASCLCQTRWW